MEARAAIRAIRKRREGEADPGGPVVAFRGAPVVASAMSGHCAKAGLTVVSLALIAVGLWRWATG